MKKLFTCSYSGQAKAPKEMTRVRTSVGCPKGMGDMLFEFDLTPESMRKRFQGLPPEPGDWKEKYRAQMEKLHAKGTLKKIVDRLPENALLLCYEGRQCDCHRGILASFLVEHGLAEVEEWTPPTTQPPEKKVVTGTKSGPSQMSLF